jgi:exopolysaccharide biosynthesis polyprenyl glycosylphosphotransferase
VAADLLRREGYADYSLVGFVQSSAIGEESVSRNTAILGTVNDLPRLVVEAEVAEVIFADNELASAELTDTLIRLYESGIQVRLLSDVYEQMTGKIPVEHIKGHWFAVLPHTAGGGRPYDIAKRLIDVAVSSGILVLLSPVMALLAVAIRLESAGPVLYRQSRVGLLGRPFSVVKFRTMVDNAESAGAVWAKPRDPRTTRIGRLLRQARLDETPQLWNVLVGDMSLIGPRPERPEFVAQLVEQVPFYRARLLVKPGISGWAQVRFAYAGTVADSVEKLQHDLYYVKHRSPYLDAVIAVKTLGVVARGSGY